MPLHFPQQSECCSSETVISGIDLSTGPGHGCSERRARREQEPGEWKQEAELQGRLVEPTAGSG